MKVEVHQKEQAGRNGDRATQDTVYFSYEVVFFGHHANLILQEWPGYDNVNSRIEPDARDKAENYARVFAMALDGCEYAGIVAFARKVETKITWEKVEKIK